MMFVFFGILVSLIALLIYTVFRYSVLIKACKKPTKICYWVVSAVLVIATLYPVFALNTIPWNTLQRIVQFISAVIFVVLIYSGVVFLLRDLSLLVCRIIRRRDSAYCKAVKGKRFYCIVLIVTLIMGVAGYFNMGIVRERDEQVSIAKESVNESITLAVATDLHMGTGITESNIDDMVELINSMDVDAVLLVGDLMDNNTTTTNLEILSEGLAKLKSRYGTFFSYGNHDSKKIEEYLERAGVKILSDEVAVIADDIQLVGRKDLYKQPCSIKTLELDFDKPVIVMNHQPNTLQSIADDGADLTLCGHTHGHQYPFATIFVAPANDMIYGMKTYDAMTAITTSGAGGWGFHYKLPSGSEVVKVELNFNVQ